VFEFRANEAVVGMPSGSKLRAKIRKANAGTSSPVSHAIVKAPSKLMATSGRAWVIDWSSTRKAEPRGVPSA